MHHAIAPCTQCGPGAHIYMYCNVASLHCVSLLSNIITGASDFLKTSYEVKVCSRTGELRLALGAARLGQRRPPLAAASAPACRCTARARTAPRSPFAPFARVSPGRPRASASPDPRRPCGRVGRDARRGGHARTPNATAHPSFAAPAPRIRRAPCGARAALATHCPP